MNGKRGGTRDLLTHPSNRWFNLPRTPQSDLPPKHEGPFGPLPAKFGAWLNRITYGGRHATPWFYVAVGVILSIITLIEVWMFNLHLGAWFVPLLLVLSAAKFIMVVAFFMHLRFDPKGFSIVFGAGMSLGIAVFVALLALFFKLNG